MADLAQMHLQIFFHIYNSMEMVGHHLEGAQFDLWMIMRDGILAVADALT